MKDKPYHPLDIPFVLIGAFVLFVVFAPLQHLVIRRMSVPVVDTRPAFLNGAVTMCLALADNAEVTRAESVPACNQMAQGLE